MVTKRYSRRAGPNIHVIGEISCEGVLLMTKLVGVFRNETCNTGIVQVLDACGTKEKTSATDLVCDNAPSHSRLEVLFMRPALD